MHRSIDHRPRASRHHRADEELVPLWGFEVVVVKDATAAAITTEEAVELLGGGS